MQTFYGKFYAFLVVSCCRCWILELSLLLTQNLITCDTPCLIGFIYLSCVKECSEQISLSIQVSPSHFALLITIGASLTSAFVVRTSGTGDSDEFKIEEVKVSYGDELETILHKAASDGNLGLVREIFNNEVRGQDLLAAKRS